MNETNVLRIINLIKENMFQKHNIKLNAFVLDDGWDIYKSDWVLRDKQFPHGLKPISEKLKEMNTDLGIWFGPTGGYSFRMDRINWMKENGYEIVGTESSWHSAMLCLGGKKYSALFKKRTTDFVANDSVKYFKWDGIQFSCSEPDHGHPIDIYSRRAIMESVIDKCNAVRKINPDVFLNITSGTWLSPWWLKYANQIWMQGYDYGYADVPSISKRDAAITYRDFVLYEDFHKKNLWFPISNLMTHGIIKGNLQKLGGEQEPLDKFTDNALLYFARGVSMWELYISPDILTEDEWNAISKSMLWAKDRFDILMNTEMVGGDPGEMKPYGYVHFKGRRGIIAARNPHIDNGDLEILLSPAYGLERGLDNLVLERVYPSQRISTKLFSTGEKIKLNLEGFETAVYEIYPLSEAEEPLIADCDFEMQSEGNNCTINLYQIGPDTKFINPEKINSVIYHNTSKNPSDLKFEQSTDIRPVSEFQINRINNSEFMLNMKIDESVDNAELSILLKPDDDSKGEDLPVLNFVSDNNNLESVIEEQKQVWSWSKVKLEPGNHSIKISPAYNDNIDQWSGTAEVWLICSQTRSPETYSLILANPLNERIMPQLPYSGGIVKKNIKLGSFEISKNLN